MKIRLGATDIPNGKTVKHPSLRNTDGPKDFISVRMEVKALMALNALRNALMAASSLPMVNALTSAQKPIHPALNTP